MDLLFNFKDLEFVRESHNVPNMKVKKKNNNHCEYMASGILNLV